VGKVFSITDFKEGLDVRKSPLTAPGGSLRILDNCVITQGGEIEKRMAFVQVATLPSQADYLFGQGDNLHAFGVGLGAIDSGTSPVPIIPHSLEDPGGPGPVDLTDVDAFDTGSTGFYVCGFRADGDPINWWNNVIVRDAVGGAPIASAGAYARTHKTKMYRLTTTYLEFSGVNDPSVNDPASTVHPGAGFINLAAHDADGEGLQGMEVFYDKMAVLARLLTQLWRLDPDPTQDVLEQTLRIGTLAPHSVVQFGTGDVLFLSDSGVRSLKSQTVTTTAAVSDVGSAVDPLLIQLIRTALDKALDAQAVVQPITGRYWLACGDEVFVLSYFPAGNITAWSHFVLDFWVSQWAVVHNRVYARSSDNKVYLYGGVDGATYDSCKVTVRTPHMDIEGPTTRKRIQSVDVMCQGAWSVAMGMLPNNTEAFELVANIQDNTFGLQSIPFAGYGTHVGVHMEHQAPGPALLASIHLNTAEASVK
jgi:hypothetical protein